MYELGALLADKEDWEEAEQLFREELEKCSLADLHALHVFFDSFFKPGVGGFASIVSFCLGSLHPKAYKTLHPKSSALDPKALKP